MDTNKWGLPGEVWKEKREAHNQKEKQEDAQ